MSWTCLLFIQNCDVMKFYHWTPFCQFSQFQYTYQNRCQISLPSLIFKFQFVIKTTKQNPTKITIELIINPISIQWPGEKIFFSDAAAKYFFKLSTKVHTYCWHYLPVLPEIRLSNAIEPQTNNITLIFGFDCDSIEIWLCSIEI